jgi:hypothetical protein
LPTGNLDTRDIPLGESQMTGFIDRKFFISVLTGLFHIFSEKPGSVFVQRSVGTGVIHSGTIYSHGLVPFS